MENPADLSNAIEKYYILKYRKPIPCNDLYKWGKWFEKSNRKVRRTYYSSNLYLSTVFLGLNHALDYDRPLLFETMLFKNDEGEVYGRCSTWREALMMHRYARKYIEDRIKKGKYNGILYR